MHDCGDAGHALGNDPSHGEKSHNHDNGNGGMIETMIRCLMTQDLNHDIGDDP
jgi:hypothetical protein